MSTVLIVDDNEQNRYLLQTMLTASAYQVLEAANGVEALELARRNHPDLIIADILMPQMDGFALCRECKRDEQLRPIPFVFYTATYTDPRDEALALQLGAARFIIKPVEEQDFIAIIREVLQAHQAGQLPSPPPLEEETIFYRLYNEALIRKLEDKMLELEQTNRALARSEEYFRALIENASDVITVLNRDGIIRYASPACERVLGYRSEELVGENAFEWIHPDDRAPSSEVFNRAFFQPGVVSPAITVRFRHKDNSWRVFEVVGRSLRDTSDQAICIINARDVTERKRHEHELEVMVAVSTALRTVQTRAEILSLILDQLTDLLKAEGAAIARHDPASGEIVIELARGNWKQWTGRQLPPGEGSSGRVVATGQPYLCNDASNDPLMSQLGLDGQPLAVVCVPLIAHSQTTGIVWVGRNTQFAAEEVHLLTTISDMTANALHRATLYEATVRHARQLEILHEIDRAISGTMGLEIILDTLCRQAMIELQADAIGVLLLEAYDLSLHYAAGCGFRTQAYLRSRVRLGERQAGLVALERKTVHCPDIRTAVPASVHQDLFRDEGFIVYTAAPLITKGTVKGVLEVFHRRPFRPDYEWWQFFERLALQGAIGIESAQLFSTLQRSNAELSLAYDATIEGWAHALELSSKEIVGHTRRVADLTLRLARAAGITEEELVHVRRGAFLHDIGKMGIPDKIVLKPDSLLESEWTIMRQHPQLAFDLLSSIAYLRPALDIPYCHHEKWDGSGYPRGLKGDQIPLAARLFAVVDVWDALQSDRPYRPHWLAEQALEYIRSQAGKHFDPRAVELFLKIMDEDRR